MGKIIQMIVVLTGIALVSGLALGALNSATKEQIANNVLKNKKLPAVMKIYEGALGTPSDNERTMVEEDILTGRKEIDIGEKDPLLLFVIKEGGKPRTVVFERQGKGGYGGEVGVMAGFRLEGGTLDGVGITTHSETPGVGTRVQNDSFLQQFRGMDVMSQQTVALKKAGGQIDGVSGATKSSTAVADALAQAKQIFEQHRDEILSAVQ